MPKVNRLTDVPKNQRDTCDSTPKDIEIDVRSVRGTWAIVRVKSREEVAATEMLCERSRYKGIAISTYIPFVRTTREQSRTLPDGRVQRWNRKLVVPKFPGVVFAAWEDPCEVGNLLETPRFRGGTIRVPTAAGQEQLVGQLANLQTALAVNCELKSVDWIKPGIPAEIVAGPFRGTCGEIHRRDGRRVFIVAVEMLGQGVEIEVEDWQIDPVAQRVAA